jgi:predicted acylesterase/phospholipase RssA
MKTESARLSDLPSARPAPEMKFCDLIMKGGITSGVVYPCAIVELHGQGYRFKNIGGTSAGAIAAAVAAAAEHGRDQGGFAKLARVSDELGDSLLGLFQPAEPFRPLFNAFLGVLKHKSKAGRALAAFGALVLGHVGWVWAGLAPGLVMLGFALAGQPSPSYWVLTGLALLLGLVVPVAGCIIHVLRKELPGHRFGICSGLSADQDGTALTEWLSANLNDIAGLDPEGDPLTFGRLRGLREGMSDQEKEEKRRDPDINLVIMTTNLTSGRPHRLPWDTKVFMYSEQELKELFPTRVCEWMRDHSEVVPDGGAGARDLRTFPLSDDLPVVVAVRMSLSFPVLLSAVPLWAIDYTLLDRAEQETPRRCWFSDGGITSNFPIHFFDSLWPRWPTFGITLEKFDDQRHHAGEKVWLPDSARKGILREFTSIESTVDFGKAIIGTMQNWRDSMQTILPGYRERVVHIRLNKEEGGLHLSMDRDVIKGLTDLGAEAGAALDGFNMDAHKWRRWLVSMERLEDLMEDAIAASEPREGAGEGYRTFIPRYSRRPEEYKGNSVVVLERMDANAAAFADLAGEWVGGRSIRGGEFPRPETEVRIGPKV